MMRLIIAAMLMLAAPPVLAQPAPAATIAEPEPARLAAANRLIEVVMPPALREQMIEQTTAAMTANVGKAMMGSPTMMAIFEKEPRARAIFERYMAKQAEQTRAIMREMLPDMMAAMARSYARRLTVPQLEDARAFYASESGQAVTLAASSVLADPDYGAVMQAGMQRVMARTPEQAKAMADELKALGPPVQLK